MSVERDVLDIIAEAAERERQAKADLRQWVPVARDRGYTWPEIAHAIGVRPQSAHQRFKRTLVSP